jgi:hypothetical protein
MILIRGFWVPPDWFGFNWAEISRVSALRAWRVRKFAAGFGVEI